MKLALWRYNKVTGYWVRVRDVTPETKDAWLKIFNNDHPNDTFKVSASKPRAAVRKNPRARADYSYSTNDYRRKSIAELDYIIRDASEAAQAMRGMNPAAERKYLEQVADAETERNRRRVKRNPRPRIGAAKPSRPSSATGKRPSKRLVSRRKANTRKGYFPNPAEVAQAHGSVISRAAYSGSAKDYPYVIQGENYQTKKWNTIAMYAKEADAREAIKLLASRYRTPLRLMKR